MNFAKFLRTSFSTEHLRWLLLNMHVINIFQIQRELNVNIITSGTEQLLEKEIERMDIMVNKQIRIIKLAKKIFHHLHH